MRSKWFSTRAMLLHLSLVAWLAMCFSAAWWQVGRAVQGNSLSFMYSIEWPVFGILGVLGWWALLNMDRVTAGQEKARQEYEEKMRQEAHLARSRTTDSEDPSLAAYNDHLAQLATKPIKKLWGH